MEEKIDQLKNTNRETNSININTKNLYNNNINNANNKSIKPKYMFNSSSKKKNKQTYTIESCYTKSMIDYNEDKNYHILAKQVRIQNKIIEEYQKWINILIPVINDKKIDNEYKDIGTPIQEGLESIEELKNTNFKVKSLIIKEKLKNENLEKQIEKKKKTQNMLIKEYNEKDNQALNLKKEKEQLLMNLQMLANEVDTLTENNKALSDKRQKDNKLQKLYELMKEKNDLKEENKLYKKMVVLKNRKNYIDLKGSISAISSLNNYQNHKIFKRNNDTIDITDDYSSIGPMSGMGEYKLEKDENVNKNFFFCGL
jgi:hypothetical protein